VNKGRGLHLSDTINGRLDASRLKLFQGVIALSIVTMTLYGVLNLLGVKPDNSFQDMMNPLNLIGAIIIMILLVKQPQWYKVLLVITLTLTMVIFTMGFILVQEDQLRVVWFMIISMVAYSVGGKKIGNITHLISTSILIVLTNVCDCQFSVTTLITLYIIQTLLAPMMYYFVLKIEEDDREIQSNQSDLELKIIERTSQITDLLYFNQFTSLPNRLKLDEDMNIHGTPNAIVLYEIQNLGQIYDIYGQKCMRKILQGARDIIQALGDGNYDESLYHIENNQFMLINNSEQNSLAFQERIEGTVVDLEDARFKYDYNNTQLDISIDVKVAIVYHDATDNLLEAAHIAMSHIRNRKVDLITYDPSLNLEKRYFDEIESLGMFKKALDDDMLIPYFQPIKKGNSYYYECLIRLNDSGTIVPPFRFLPFVEKTKYIHTLAEFMIDRCFTYFESHEDQHFSINISYENVIDKKLREYIYHKLSHYNNPSRVIFEILETEALEDIDVVEEFIERIRSFGAKIAIDDFGTGYSNFNNLLSLKPDIVKIDGSLIKDLPHNGNNRFIVQSIVKMAHQFGIEVVAEYVENEEIYNILQEMNVDGIQGYYIGKPSDKMELKTA
jgi:EAL domain-containing protein (putative c-di-GMP-specific phosphodiesterase class I)/GGDEF domain-containing protein